MTKKDRIDIEDQAKNQEWKEKLNKDWSRKPYFDYAVREDERLEHPHNTKEENVDSDDSDEINSNSSEQKLSKDQVKSSINDQRNGEPSINPHKRSTIKNLGFAESMGHAIDGVLHTVVTERNMRIDLVIAFLVLVFSLFLNLTKIEFAILIMTIMFVLVAETVNTAIENICDLLVGDKYHPKVKIIKDAAAGATLLAAINAVIVGYMLFIDDILSFSNSVFSRLRGRNSHITFIVLGLVLIAVVILKALFYRGHGTPLRGGSVSGHSALAFSMATIIALSQTSSIIAILAVLLALFVAESRYEGKIHTPGEIFFGALLGIGIAGILFGIFM